jgi:hypothetical protein
MTTKCNHRFIDAKKSPGQYRYEYRCELDAEHLGPHSLIPVFIPRWKGMPEEQVPLDSKKF